MEPTPPSRPLPQPKVPAPVPWASAHEVFQRPRSTDPRQDTNVSTPPPTQWSGPMEGARPSTPSSPARDVYERAEAIMRRGSPTRDRVSRSPTRRRPLPVPSVSSLAQAELMSDTPPPTWSTMPSIATSSLPWLPRPEQRASPPPSTSSKPLPSPGVDSALPGVPPLYPPTRRGSRPLPTPGVAARNDGMAVPVTTSAVQTEIVRPATPVSSFIAPHASTPPPGPRSMPSIPMSISSRSATPSPTVLPVIMIEGEVMTDDMMDPMYEPNVYDNNNNNNHEDEVSANITLSDEPVPQHASHSSAAERETWQGSRVSEGITSTCHRCQRWIGGYMVHALGHAWHARCFTCRHCGTLLEHVSFYEHDGEPYCHLDFHELFSRRCYHCKTPIVDERFITVDALGDVRTYHEMHFFCASCGDPFVDPKDSDESTHSEVSKPFFVHGHHAYCEKCNRRLYGPRCQGCRQPIGDEEEYIEALRAKWHPRCLKCTRCGQPCRGAVFVLPDGSPCDFDCYQAWTRGGRSGPAPPAFLT